MMKKISYLAIAVSLATLAGCGGGGSGDSGMIAGSNNSNTGNNNSSGNTTNQGSCNRGVLLNSKLSDKSIFDEQLYSIDGLSVQTTTNNLGYKYGIYGEQISHDGQMLYSNYTPIYNLTNLEIETDEQYLTDSYVVNSSGLYTSKLYSKQTKGWPTGYINTENNLNISITPFNDECNFSALKVDFIFKKIDISGKKIKDILPLKTYNDSKNIIPDYVSTNTANILYNDSSALSSLLNSSETFPLNSYLYLPQSANYTENHFIFGEDWLDKNITSLDDWIKNYNHDKLNYKKDIFGGYKVAYPADENGNMIYLGNIDQPIEKDGKIYSGEWIIKGDILSINYGISKNNSSPAQMPTGDYTLYNKTTYDFITKQIQTYYK